MPNSWKKWSVAFALLALAVGTGACRKEGKSAGARRRGAPNLLLITLDTTRADRIGAYGDARACTPNLDRLAREGARVERAYAEAPLTLPSHVSILTGREPPSHQVRNNGTYALRAEETTLAEILKNAGYSTQAMVAAFVLERKFGLAQGFDGYDDTLDKERQDTTYRSEITADRVHEKFTRWLSVSPASPFFCWVHFYDPHAPYEPPKHLRERFCDAPYRGEIAFVDETIGRMLQELDRRGLMDNTLVVAVGDHGEGFGEHAESGHGLFCYEETLRVPLILHYPKRFPGGRVVPGPVGLIDVLPTLLELLHLPPSTGVQGRSFARQLTTKGDAGDSSTIHYFESLYGLEEMGFAPLSGLICGSLKFISLPRPELYDLAT
ncbi:MAG TPA: sulfatase, partial [Candidatus Aminicenantes bacterium]|nr:sulfatase [Candidatus Aminicenantes bacterium]